MFCLASSGSKLFAKVISRRQKSQLVGKGLRIEFYQLMFFRSEGLAGVYLAVFSRVRKHLNMPNIFCSGESEDNIRDFCKVRIVAYFFFFFFLLKAYKVKFPYR